MKAEIKERIEKIKKGEVPEGYKKNGSRFILEQWELKCIGKLVDRIRNPVKVDMDKKYKQIGIRSHGKGLFYKDEVTGLELGNKAVFWIEPNCFIVNIVFAWEMAVARTTNYENGMIVSHRFPMYKPLKGKLDVDYLTYFFKTKWGNNLLELASPGGAGRNKTLGQTEFLELKIPVPSLIEQQKIVIILSTWDKAIELKEELIKQKKEQKRGLMKKLLSGEARLPGFNGEWKEVELGDICNVTTGKLDANAMREDGKYKFFTCAREVFQIDKYAFDTDALLISGNGANVGYIHYYKGKFNAYQRTYVLNDFTENIFFIKFMLEQYLSNRIEKEKNAGNTPYIVLGTLTRMKIKVPPCEVQTQISNALTCIDKEINLLEQELQYLKLQKKGLMQLLLTGIVRVKV